jgi:ribonuclease P protein component
MLARRHRFHGHSSLTFVYRHGATVRGQHIAVRFVRNTRRPEYRLAVIVSRKVHKSAVQRNRIRRRIYEVVRTGKPIPIAYDIVVTVFSDQIAALPPAELTPLVRNLFDRAGLYPTAPTDTNRSDHDIVKKREDQ